VIFLPLSIKEGGRELVVVKSVVNIDSDKKAENIGLDKGNGHFKDSNSNNN
jgi:hypothetical protein